MWKMLGAVHWIKTKHNVLVSLFHTLLNILFSNHGVNRVTYKLPIGSMLPEAYNEIGENNLLYKGVTL